MVINVERAVIPTNADLAKKLLCKLVDVENLTERSIVGGLQVTMKKKEYLCAIESVRNLNLAGPINVRESAVKPAKETTLMATISASKFAEKLSIVAIIPAQISVIWVTVNNALF